MNTNSKLKWIVLFLYIQKKIKEVGNVEKSLIPNVLVLCNLVIVNPEHPVTFYTPE